MSPKARHLFAFLLLWVFFTPTAGKLLDEAFHHHLLFRDQAKGETVHIFHRACPIPGFTLSFFTTQKQIRTTEKRTCLTRVYVHFRSGQFPSFLGYATLLRAPPLSVVWL